ncbi:tetratricopeptide repeat protein [Paraurantiacibacter namhicola]|uniref:Tetratricopeptide repeat protein n=1 Tax=Paraurantiacibacter namhicola TaxID=645517 RepID=A0A1C7D8Q1_9SPHN|nr:tetratricopeptide repeat protein [Paraurantiacibacter namhicola]ANU07866.1 tetratricopeptide repeat protein [Paraurantiacibacter namhicola]
MTSRRKPLLAALAAALLALPLSAQEQRDWLAEAAVAIASGDGIAAEVLARRALEAGVPRSRVAPYLGRAELLQGELGEARRWLEGENFAPEAWREGYHALALLRMAEGDGPAAARAFDRALERGPGTAELWVDFGRLRYRGGEQHLAREAVMRALELGPDDPRALVFRAQLARDSEGLVAATAWFERALKTAPDDVDLMGEYAATLGEAGRYTDMLRVVRQMHEIEPAHPRIYYLQAVLAARTGQDNLARRLLYRTGEVYAESPAYLMLTGIIELRGGNARLAVEQFDQLVRRQPQNAAARLLFGRALLANGEGNEAIAQLQPPADRPDASPYLLTLVGRAFEQEGDREQAANYLDRASNARIPQGVSVLPNGEGDELLVFRFGDEPDRGDVAVARLRQMLGQDNSAGARAVARQISGRYSHSSDMEIVLGDTLLLTGDPANALGNYARSASVRRPFSLILRMAAAQRALGNEAAARLLVMNYLRQNPMSGDAAAMLGYLHLASGNAAMAARYFDYALALGHGRRDPYLLRALAEARLQSGKVDGAMDSAIDAYRVQRSSGPVADTLADIARRAGRGEDAAVFARKAQRSVSPQP